MLRLCISSDAPAISRIYNHYVQNTDISFEEEPVSVDQMTRRITDVTAHYPWLVWEQAGALVGYAYATPWKSRTAYRHSVETTIYLGQDVAGQGIGTQLYGALLNELRVMGVHCAIGGTALPNPASVALHEKLGFSKVAEFREVGRKHGRWVDVGYWELIL